MSKVIEVTVHEIAQDGLPDMDDEDLVGRVAFLWDGSLSSGWPIRGEENLWETDGDMGASGTFSGVTHWLEFPMPFWDIERNGR